MRRSSIYGYGRVAWALFAFVLGVAVVPRLVDLPWLGVAVIPVTLALIGVGWVAGLRLERRAWTATGRRLDLAPEGGGLLGKPDLVGTVDGRPIRARTLERRSRTRGHSSSRTTTVVEAELDAPADEGIVVGHTGDDADPGPIYRIGGVPDDLVVDRGRLGTIGGTDAGARTVATGDAGDAILAAEGITLLYVGDVAGGLPESASSLAEAAPGDPSSVAAETGRLLLDHDEMRSQLTAVVAAADAYERANRGAGAFE